MNIELIEHDGRVDVVSAGDKAPLATFHGPIARRLADLFLGVLGAEQTSAPKKKSTLEQAKEVALMLEPEEVARLRKILKPHTHDKRCREMGAPRRSDDGTLYMCHLQCPIRSKTGRSVNE